MSAATSGGGSSTDDAIAVRRLRPDEWAALRDIRLRALADAPEAFGSTLAEEVGRGDDAWRDWASRADRGIVVAELAGRLVGLASGGPAPDGDGGAGLYAMWVDPALRGSGVAADIVALVEDWARAAGYADDRAWRHHDQRAGDRAVRTPRLRGHRRAPSASARGGPRDPGDGQVARWRAGVTSGSRRARPPVGRAEQERTYAADAPAGRNDSTTSHGMARLSRRWMPRSASTSPGETSEIAVPEAPARPVRPMRWM